MVIYFILISQQIAVFGFELREEVMFVLFATDNTRDRNWTYKELELKGMFIHTRGSAPKRFVKFGWRTRTF